MGPSGTNLKDGKCTAAGERDGICTVESERDGI